MIVYPLRLAAQSGCGHWEYLPRTTHSARPYIDTNTHAATISYCRTTGLDAALMKPDLGGFLYGRRWKRSRPNDADSGEDTQACGPSLLDMDLSIPVKDLTVRSPILRLLVL